MRPAKPLLLALLLIVTLALPSRARAQSQPTAEERLAAVFAGIGTALLQVDPANYTVGVLEMATMYFHEAAAYILCAVPSGAPGVQTPHPAKAVMIDGITPMEARFGVDMAGAAAELNRGEANERVMQAKKVALYLELTSRFEVPAGEAKSAVDRLLDQIEF